MDGLGLQYEDLDMGDAPPVAPDIAGWYAGHAGGTDEVVNLATSFTREQRDDIAKRIVGGFDRDRDSRKPWAERLANIRRLFACLRKKRSHPWPNAANVNNPGILIALEQWVAREFQQLTADTEGPLHVEDPGNNDSHRARRVKESTNSRLRAERRYFDGLDRLVALVGLDGTALRKIWYDPIKQKKCRQTVTAAEVVVSYDYSDDIRDCRRITHVLRMMPDEIQEQVAHGLYIDANDDEGKPLGGGRSYSEISDESLERVSREVEGVDLDTGQTSESDSAPNSDIPSSDSPRVVLECHCVMKLPGDALPQPYIVTVDYETKRTLRITSRLYEDDDGTIKTQHHWVKYGFFPNPDGFYDFGLGGMLESHNEVANTTANQLLDAGTLANVPSGLISDRFGLKKGMLLFEPGELKPVEGFLDDINKGVHVFQWPGPSNVIFQMLGAFLQQMKEMSGFTDVLLGSDQPTNQPATTTISLIEQGLKVFTAVHQRILCSYGEELGLEYELDRRYLGDQEHNEVLGEDDSPEFLAWLEETSAYPQAMTQWVAALRQGMLMPAPSPPRPYPFSVRDDFAPGLRIRPSADPKVSSITQEVMIAEKAYMTIMQNPLTQGLVPVVREALRRFLVAMGVPNPQQLLPPEPTPPPDLDQYVENAMFMSGDFSAKVLPEQDHAQHLLAIAELEQEPLYQEQMWPDRKKALEAHKLEHLAQLYLQQKGLNPDGTRRMETAAPAQAPGPGLGFADAGLGQEPADGGIPADAGLGEALGNAPPSLIGRMDGMYEASGSDLVPG